MGWDCMALHGIAASYTFRVYIKVSWRQLTHITYLPALVSFSSRLDNYMPYYPFSIFTIYMLYILIWCIYGCRFDGPDVRHFFFIIKMIETERSRKRGTLCSYTESERAVRFGIKKNLKKRREEKKMRWEKRKKWEALHSIALGNYIPTMNDDDDHLFSLSRLGWRDKVALAFNYNPRRKVKTDETGRTLIIIEKADFYFILFYFIWRAMRTTTDLGGCVILYTTRHRASMIRRWVRRRPLQLPFRQFRVPHSIDTHIIKIKKSPASQTFSIADSPSSWLFLFLCVTCTEQHDWPDDEAAAVNDVIYDQVVVPVWYRFWAAANRMRSPGGSHIYCTSGNFEKRKKKAQHFSVPYKNDIESY